MSYYKPVLKNIFYMQTDFYEQMLRYYIKVKKDHSLEILNQLLEEIERDIKLSQCCASEDYMKGMQFTLNSYKLKAKKLQDAYVKIIKPVYKQQTLF
jgi:hypothetical protein